VYQEPAQGKKKSVQIISNITPFLEVLTAEKAVSTTMTDFHGEYSISKYEPTPPFFFLTPMFF